jgi:hypothetical protein
MTPRRLKLLVGYVLVVIAGACASAPETSRFTYVGPIPDTDQTLAPDYDGFKKGPQEYLERRCATLDCHGELGRPLRLFSGNGLRAFDASNGGSFPNLSGRSATTEDEIRANYLAVIGLEPEVMGEVIAEKAANPKKLLLLKKPLALESHKGGRIMVDESDFGYRCINSWLAGGPLDQTSCDQGAKFPSPK